MPEQPPGRTATRKKSSGSVSDAMSSLTLIDAVSVRVIIDSSGWWSPSLDRHGHVTGLSIVQRRELLHASPADRVDHALADPPVELAHQLGVGLGELAEGATQE